MGLPEDRSRPRKRASPGEEARKEAGAGGGELLGLMPAELGAPRLAAAPREDPRPERRELRLLLRPGEDMVNGFERKKVSAQMPVGAIFARAQKKSPKRSDRTELRLPMRGDLHSSTPSMYWKKFVIFFFDLLMCC